MFLVKRNKIRVLLSTTIFALLAVFVFGNFTKAQVTNNKLLDVSAYILNQENKAIANGKYKIRFAIYTSDRTENDPYPSNSDAGSRIWEEEQEIEVTNGLFDAYLGAENPLPEDLNLADSVYYLGIRVGEDSETAPRKKMGFVPAALNAVNSTFVNGATTGTEEGNILLLGKDGKIDLEQLPTGTDSNSIVLGDDGRLHDQNTDIGTDSTKFNIGSGTGITGNFDLTVSNAANKPTIRFNGSTQEWQFSTDGIGFDSLGVGSDLQAQIDQRSLIGHTHAISDITSGILDVALGGTGINNIPMGSILFSDSSNHLIPFTGGATDNEDFLRFNWNGGNPYLSWSSDVASSFSSFTVGGDSGTGQNIIDGNNLLISGGSNLSSIASDTDVITLNLDSTLTGVTWNGNAIDISSYTNLITSGSLLTLSGDTLSVKEGTLSDGRLCTYSTANGIVCDTLSSSVGHTPLSIGTPANGLSVDGSQTLSLALASAATTGALSNSDWTAFNNKVSSQWVTTGSNIYYSTGNIGLGTSTIPERLTIDGNIQLSGNIIATNSSQDVGSATQRFDYGYFENLDVINMSVGGVDISGSTSNVFTINSNNVTNDGEDSFLAFDRGENLGVPNSAANIQWNSANDRFDFNFPLNVSGAVTATGFTIGAETVTDWTGTGITINSGSLTASLGDSIDISSESNLAVGGNLLVLTDDTLSVKAGTLTTGRLCTYDTTSGLVCNTDSGTVGHSALTINAIANGLSVDGSQVLTLALA
ncbi:MAG: hypothetical protein WAV16_00130, partial [Candidatus Moraniibacteriota bacterium]